MTDTFAAAPADPSTLDVATLETEITTLAGHLAAATARFLALLAAFDTAGGWQQIGISSCAQWLSWRCGLSPTTAREQLRVARRLRELPAVAAVFGAGELSYSKVRAISRVATPATEADLVGVAKNATAEQVHRLCRGLRRAQNLEEAVHQQAAASFSHHWDDDGTLRFKGRLPAEAGAMLLRAIEAQRRQAGADTDTHEDPDTGVAETVVRTRRNQCADALPDDDCRGRAELAARSDADALVGIASHLLECSVSSGGKPVRLVVHTTEAALAASGPLGQHWTGAATATSAAVGDHPDPASTDTRPAGDPTCPPSQVEEAAVSDIADQRPGGVIENGPGLLPETVQRLACNAVFERAGDPDARDGEPERDERQSASRRQRIALFRRDGGCRFPGCARTRNLQAHHVKHHATGGRTVLDNLVLLCHHHHVLLHEGQWRLEWSVNVPGGAVKASLALHHPGGPTTRRTTLSAVGPRGERVTEVPGLTGALHELPRKHRRHITASTVTGAWDGSPLDLAYAVSVFAAADVCTRTRSASAEASSSGG